MVILFIFAKQYYLPHVINFFYFTLVHLQSLTPANLWSLKSIYFSAVYIWWVGCCLLFLLYLLCCFLRSWLFIGAAVCVGVCGVVFLVQSMCRSKVSPQVSFTRKDVLSERMETMWLWNVCVSFSLWNKIWSHAIDPFVIYFQDGENNLRYRNDPNPSGLIYLLTYSYCVIIWSYHLVIFIY